MQVSLFPEITFPKIKIIADAGLQPVNNMMVTVTKPLENAIKQVPGLKDIRSITSRGSCEISALMDWSEDLDISQQRIESKISQVRNDLPPDVQLTIEKMNPSILPVMGYTVENHNMSAVELKKLATLTIKPFLSQIEGVSEVRIIGGKSKEYWLQLDPEKMSALGITPDVVMNVLNETNFVKSNGYLSDYRYLYLTVTDATMRTKEDLEKIIISPNAKRIIQIKDIGKVTINAGIEYTKINANGKEGILIAIIKQPNANVVDLADAMKIKVAELKKVLPKNTTIQPYYIQADFVSQSVKSVTDSLWIGLLLAIIVAIIFLRSFKASATILITIPVTLSLTLVVMYAINYTLNIMTLGAIAAAIGLIIDDAIVVVEQIHRTHEENPDEPTTTLLQQAIKYLFPAMVGSSLSTIVIFIPFVLMSGVAGAYFSVMTNTMIITLVCSFFITWICLPVIYLLLTKNAKDNTHKKTHKSHEVKQRKWVSFFIARPVISIVFSALLAVSMVLIIPHLETGFLPEMDEGSIVLDYVTPPGTSLDETDRILTEIEKIIVNIPEVKAYSRRTGTEMGFFITEPNSGDYLIQLKENRTRSTEEVTSDIRQQVEASQPALQVDFGQVIGDMLGDLMASVQPIEIKVFGEDQEKLKTLSAQVAAEVEQVSGTADVFDGVVIAGPSITIQPDFDKLSMYGITATNLQMQLQTALEGNTAGNILEREQLTPIRMVYEREHKTGIDDLRNMDVFLPNGVLHPLADLATIKVQQGEAEVQRENLQSMGVITGRLENRDLGTVIKEIKQRIEGKIALPVGYHIEYGGAYAEQQQSFRELLMILITSSLLVFGVILFLYKDFRVAMLILLIGVLGISGSFLALYLTQTPLNVGSYTGLIMIVGVIGENAIFTFLQFRESLHNKGADDAIVYAISTRLRPKLMTALGAIIALLPLALGIGAGAQLHQPLAIAVIGGFIVAMPLLLIVLPTLLRMIFKKYTAPVLQKIK